MTKLSLQSLCVERFAEGTTATRQGLCAGGAAGAMRGLLPKVRRLPIVAPEPACKEACSYCCHLQVAALVPEVLVLAEHIRRAGKVERMLAVVGERLALIRGLNETEYAKLGVPCAFLVPGGDPGEPDGNAGTCAVYPARPISCRAHNSIDVTGCIEPGAIIGSSSAIRYGASMQMIGAMAEFRKRGLAPLAVELHAGLEIALQTPDAESRWLACEALFTPAALDQGDLFLLDELTQGTYG